MVEKEKIDFFNQCLDLESLNFTKIHEDPEFLYEQVQGDISVFIDYSFERNKFHSVGTWITFNIVEDLLKQYYLKYQLPPDRRLPMTLSLYKFISYNKFFSEAREIAMDSSEDIKMIASTVRSHIIENFKPLWGKYADLQTINDELINKISQRDISDYIIGETPLKKSNYSGYLN